MFKIHYSNFSFHNIVETNKKPFPWGYREIYIHILLFGTDARTPDEVLRVLTRDGHLFYPQSYRNKPSIQISFMYI